MADGKARLSTLTDALDNAWLSGQAATPEWDRYEQLFHAIARDLDTPIRWRPIGEAPKDGTRIVGRIEPSEWSREIVSTMSWGRVSTGYARAGWKADVREDWNPTHWCPLHPEPTP